MPNTLTALTISQMATDFDDVSGKLLASDGEELLSDVAVEEAATPSAAGAVESCRAEAAAIGPGLLTDAERAHSEAGVR
jgi:hypothetical protein